MGHRANGGRAPQGDCTEHGAHGVCPIPVPRMHTAPALASVGGTVLTTMVHKRYPWPQMIGSRGAHALNSQSMGCPVAMPWSSDTPKWVGSVKYYHEAGNVKKTRHQQNHVIKTGFGDLCRL